MTSLYLEEVIKQEEEPILIDTSALFGNTGIKHYIKEGDIRAFDSSILKEDLDLTRNAVTILENKKVYTIAETTKEISYYHKLVKDKRDYLKIIQAKKHKNPSSLERENGDVLGMLVENSKRLVRASKKAEYLKEFQIDENSYNYFLDMFKLISRSLDLKTKSFKRNSERYPDLYTDEKLCALGTYISIETKEPTTIISKDSDFIRILYNSIKYISDPYFDPFNSEIAKVLNSKARPKLFFSKMQSNEYYNPHYDQNRMKLHKQPMEHLPVRRYCGNCKWRSLSEKENRDFRFGLMDILESYSNYQESIKKEQQIA